MDPNASLIFIRAAIDLGEFENAALVFKELDKWIMSGGFIPSAWVSTEFKRDSKGRERMNEAQRNRLWNMCRDYGVPFREDDYFLSAKQSGIGAGWVEGWIGGKDCSGITGRKTIYVGVSPEGESHT